MGYPALQLPSKNTRPVMHETSPCKNDFNMYHDLRKNLVNVRRGSHCLCRVQVSRRLTKLSPARDHRSHRPGARACGVFFRTRCLLVGDTVEGSHAVAPPLTRALVGAGIARAARPVAEHPVDEVGDAHGRQAQDAQRHGRSAERMASRAAELDGEAGRRVDVDGGGLVVVHQADAPHGQAGQRGADGEVEPGCRAGEVWVVLQAQRDGLHRGQAPSGLHESSGEHQCPEALANAGSEHQQQLHDGRGEAHGQAKPEHCSVGALEALGEARARLCADQQPDGVHTIDKAELRERNFVVHLQHETATRHVHQKCDEREVIRTRDAEPLPVAQQDLQGLPQVHPVARGHAVCPGGLGLEGDGARGCESGQPKGCEHDEGSPPSEPDLKPRAEDRRQERRTRAHGGEPARHALARAQVWEEVADKCLPSHHGQRRATPLHRPLQLELVYTHGEAARDGC
mmetsp:Transcript_43531/g.107685  ORF Transcript_43531/g.107685 Transcript_43531/m.107685 type:complete len:456 (+) Transcript_43531:168-1535(+)